MERIKEKIKILCENEKFCLDYEKLNIKTTVDCRRMIPISNYFQVYYHVMLADGDTCVHIESCCDPESIAFYAVSKLVELKNQKKESKTKVEKSFFRRIFK